MEGLIWDADPGRKWRAALNLPVLLGPVGGRLLVADQRQRSSQSGLCCIIAAKKIYGIYKAGGA